jgi:hypothetical protein
VCGRCRTTRRRAAFGKIERFGLTFRPCTWFFDQGDGQERRGMMTRWWARFFCTCVKNDQGKCLSFCFMGMWARARSGLKVRKGEFEIDSINSVEDTKGNNGERGCLMITNLRMIWFSSKSQRTNLSASLVCLFFRKGRVVPCPCRRSH